MAGRNRGCRSTRRLERSRDLRARTRSAFLLLRDLVAGELRRRRGQDLPLGRKPVLLGLAVRAALRSPHLIGAFANAIFQAVIHVSVLCDGRAFFSRSMVDEE